MLLTQRKEEGSSGEGVIRGIDKTKQEMQRDEYEHPWHTRVTRLEKHLGSTSWTFLNAKEMSFFIR